MEQHPHTLVAIVFCNDIDASTAFYARLGLAVLSDYGRYRILGDGKGWLLHLSAEAPKGWVVLAAIRTASTSTPATSTRSFAGADLLENHRPCAHKPWGMYEFAVSDPDGTLVQTAGRDELLTAE